MPLVAVVPEVAVVPLVAVVPEVAVVPLVAVVPEVAVVPLVAVVGVPGGVKVFEPSPSLPPQAVNAVVDTTLIIARAKYFIFIWNSL